MLNTDQRPSKHVIVDASVAYHKAQQAKLEKAINAIQELMAERDDLLQELNTLRPLCEPVTTTLRHARPIDPAVLAMLSGGHDPEGANCNSPRPGPEFALAPKEPEVPVEHGLPQTSSMPLMFSPPVQTQIPHLPDHSHGNVHPLSLAYDAVEWSLQDQNQGAHLSMLPVHRDGPTLQWTQSRDPSTTTPPKDLSMEYNVSPLHLVDNAALFWTQHPSVLANTPPRDADLNLNPNASEVLGGSFLWPEAIGMTTPTASSNNNQAPQDQSFQSANSFIPNPEHLSI